MLISSQKMTHKNPIHNQLMCYSYLAIRALFDSAQVQDPRNQFRRTNPKDTRLKPDARSDSTFDDCPYPLCP